MISPAYAVASCYTNVSTLGPILPQVNHHESQVLVVPVVPIGEGFILWELLLACRCSGHPASLFVVWTDSFVELLANAIFVAADEREVGDRAWLDIAEVVA